MKQAKTTAGSEIVRCIKALQIAQAGWESAVATVEAKRLVLEQAQAAYEELRRSQESIVSGMGAKRGRKPAKLLQRPAA